jgi:hypothetical protein
MRKAVREDIISWIPSGDRDGEPNGILWLTGSAGTGKSAVTGSIAEACEESRLLAATFFFSSFSGSANTRSKRCLGATLAHQIAQLDEYEALSERI